MITKIDQFMDRFSMYRLLIYYLLSLIGLAVILALFRDISYNPLSIILTSSITVFACWFINLILASIFDLPTAFESSIITGLILSLIISPTLGLYNILFMIAASGLAMASKYILTYKHKHIFNPAAIAVVLTAFGPHQTASWWIGTSSMLPLVIIGGYLLIRKIKRIQMFLTYLVTTSLSTILFALISKISVSTSIYDMVFDSAVFFLGFVMLTEPLTSPVNKKHQLIYGGIVGFLLPPQVHLLNFYTTPEIALVLGNIYSFIVNPKVNILPLLKEKIRLNKDSLEFVFNPTKNFSYLPGQYMEWTIPHSNTDSRGNRRYFTLSSSPTEKDIRIGVKFNNNGSSFKEAMINLNKNSLLLASNLGGDFVLPKNKDTKLVFIAGGIGITPFRSMLKYLIDKDQKRDIILFYSVKKEDEICYKEILREATQQLGIKIYFVITDSNSNSGNPNIINQRLSVNILKKTVEDLDQRLIYISGPNILVEQLRRELKSNNIPAKNIITDLFSGYS